MTAMTGRVDDVLATLERRGTKRTRDGLARYGIHTTKAFGVPVGTIQQIAKKLGKDRDLALAWSSRREEFVKRTAFALLASLALHDKKTGDAPFRTGLKLIERAATDERNFVKKGVSWALRMIGRRNQALNATAVETSRRLAESDDATARWIGKGAVRELTSPAVRKKLAGKTRR